MFIEYDLSNKLNLIFIMLQIYQNKDKYKKTPRPIKYIPDSWLTDYNKLHSLDHCKPLSYEQAIDQPYNFTTDYNPNIIQVLSSDSMSYNDVFNNNSNGYNVDTATQIFNNFIYNLRELSDVENTDTDIRNGYYYYKDPVTHKQTKRELDPDNIKTYTDPTPNNIRDLKIQPISNGWIIADLKYHFVFTITREPKPININAPELSSRINSAYPYTINFYKYSEKNIDTLIAQDLLQHQLDQPIRAKDMSSVLKLWNYQFIENKDNFKTTKDIDIKNIEANTDFVKFLISLLSLLKYNTENNVLNITYRNLFDFYIEVQNKQLTNKSSKMITLLSNMKGENNINNLYDYDKDDLASYRNVINTFSLHEHFNYLNNNFKELKLDNEELAPIFNKFKKDHYFSNEYEITNVYKVNHDTDTRDRKLYPNTMLGIHGTQNSSIPSILFNGLKNIDELREMINNQRKNYNEEQREKKNNEQRHIVNVKYTESGQALGMGIYFANLYTPSKSTLFITNSNNVGYFFIISIAYNKKKVYHSSSFGDTPHPKDKPTLIIGDSVGVRGKSEYVAPLTKNVRIEYLVKIKQK